MFLLMKVFLVVLYVFSASYTTVAQDQEHTKWGNWSEYGPCSKTCGRDATKIKTRRCVVTLDLPDNENEDCIENEFQEYKAKCRLPLCKVNGGWGVWSQKWSECESTNCTSTKGYRYKFRSCTNPTPKNGGSMCQGALVRYEECNEPTNCPVDGDWGDWSVYECDIEDGEYVAKRSRNCTNPEPKFGGDPCERKGPGFERVLRNDDPVRYDTELCSAFVRKNPPNVQKAETTTPPAVDDEYDYEENDKENN